MTSKPTLLLSVATVGWQENKDFGIQVGAVTYPKWPHINNSRIRQAVSNFGPHINNSRIRHAVSKVETVTVASWIPILDTKILILLPWPLSVSATTLGNDVRSHGVVFSDS